MLYFIGIGLGDELDITLRGLEALKKSDKVYYENYTSISSAFQGLENLTEKKFVLADRDLVESNADIILEEAHKGVVSFLVIGDVFGATTHTDLFLRAVNKNIGVEIINNASIINVVGNTGLELYRFGQTTSIVFDDNNWLPDAPYLVLKKNFEAGLHTLFLLDIKTAEPSLENLRKGIKKPEPPRFMTINQAINILQRLEEKHGFGLIKNDTLFVGVARIGCNDEKIVSGSLDTIKNTDFGEPLHSLIIPGKLHDIEKQMLQHYNDEINDKV